MNWGHLADHFVGVGIKRLSDVDAEPKRSNQHEVGTTTQMREFLGEKQRKEFNVTYIWLNDDQDNLVDFGKATHYNSRKKKKRYRSAEWRLYYESNQVTKAMRSGDTLLIAYPKQGKDQLKFIVAPAGSISEQQLFHLFEIKPSGKRFCTHRYEGNECDLDFVKRVLLDEIGVETQPHEYEEIDELLADFTEEFPTSRQLSELARSSLSNVSVEVDPDRALMAWLEREEALFRRLEVKLYSDRIEKGFIEKSGVEFDEFISFALSILNRRKARMGRSLENHLEVVFELLNIPFSREPITENRNKPDFIFPSIKDYKEAPKSGNKLFMLGVKSTCKDRWRQVLSEAEKIQEKHLLTLQRGISENQTNQMRQENLTLVVPKPIHVSYSENQRKQIMSLQAFIDLVIKTV